MSDQPENPQAFPGPMQSESRYNIHEGMSLHDYFAAHAPISMADAEESLASEGHHTVTHSAFFQRLARMRFGYADAMLKARQA